MIEILADQTGMKNRINNPKLMEAKLKEIEAREKLEPKEDKKPKKSTKTKEAKKDEEQEAAA